MKLSNLTRNIQFNQLILPKNEAEITGINIDSRQVKSGDLFIAMRGTQVDGHKYIIDSSLDVMNEELNPNIFFKISRSCIVAMNAIKSIIKQPGGRLRIDTNPTPPYEMTVSRSRVDDFLDWLER